MLTHPIDTGSQHDTNTADFQSPVSTLIQLRGYRKKSPGILLRHTGNGDGDIIPPSWSYDIHWETHEHMNTHDVYACVYKAHRCIHTGVHRQCALSYWRRQYRWTLGPVVSKRLRSGWFWRGHGDWWEDTRSTLQDKHSDPGAHQHRHMSTSHSSTTRWHAVPSTLLPLQQ